MTSCLVVDLAPNQTLQRLERSGDTVKGISLHRMKRKAAGRVCGAAHELHCNRRERRSCNRGVSWAGSLSLGC